MQKASYQGKIKIEHFKLSLSRIYDANILQSHLKINGKALGKKINKRKPDIFVKPAAKGGESADLASGTVHSTI